MTPEERKQLEVECRQLEERADDLQDQLTFIELGTKAFSDAYDAILDKSKLPRAARHLRLSDVLKQMDSSAYVDGLVDYVDSLDEAETGPYQSIKAELDEIWDRIEELWAVLKND